ncbi:hypothetical protein [Palleronia caenipelagi]|nr:hypothetical protein [Palleronia caenipelagi]
MPTRETAPASENDRPQTPYRAEKVDSTGAHRPTAPSEPVRFDDWAAI